MVRQNPGWSQPLVMKELARRWNEHKAKLAAEAQAAPAPAAAAAGGASGDGGDDDEVVILSASASAPQQKAAATSDGGLMEGLVRNLAGLTVWG